MIYIYIYICVHRTFTICEQEVIDKEFQGVTILLIAHRLLSVRRLCSRVIVMNSGKIVLQGEPEHTLQLAFRNNILMDQDLIDL